MACASGKNDNVLSKPLDFKKVSKHDLFPPSIYSNQATRKTSSNIKTPSHFTVKQSTTSEEKPDEIHKQILEGGQLDLVQNSKSETFLKSDKTNVASHRNITNNLCQTEIKKSKSFDIPLKPVHKSPGTCPQHPDAVPSQETGNEFTVRNECISGEGTSKTGYKELEEMYIESKNKLEKLEKQFSKISKTCGEKTAADNSSNIDLVKQLENIRLQNQVLSGKLQTLEQCQFSDVKVVVDRYLTQNQYESEKDALNSTITKLERTIVALDEEKQKLLRDIEHKDEKYDKAMIRNKEERYSYEECINKLNIRISEMIDENERIRDEKEDFLMKYENSVKTIADMNQVVETKNKCIDEVGIKLKDEMNKSMELSNTLEKQREAFEAALVNVERMLKEEVAINRNLDGQLRQQDLVVKELEHKVRQLTNITHESQYNNDIIKSLKKNLDSQCEENVRLQHLCQTLQSTNESLNVHMNSLNEVLHMQEPYTGIINGEQNAQMLQMWREKVYSLLVLLKMQELKTKPSIDDADIDGSSVL